MGRVLATLTIALLGAPLGAQTLGELAAREKAKREEKARAGRSPAKVYTNADLGEDETAPSERWAAGRSAAHEGPAAEAAPAPRDESESAAWDDRAREVRSALSGAQARLAEVEKRIGDLRARLDPTSTRFEVEGADVGEGGLASRQVALREQLARAESELEGAREALVAAEQAWQEFARAARSAGAPASVLREPSP